MSIPGGWVVMTVLMATFAACTSSTETPADQTSGTVAGGTASTSAPGSPSPSVKKAQTTEFKRVGDARDARPVLRAAVSLGAVPATWSMTPNERGDILAVWMPGGCLAGGRTAITWSARGRWDVDADKSPIVAWRLPDGRYEVTPTASGFVLAGGPCTRPVDQEVLAYYVGPRGGIRPLTVAESGPELADGQVSLGCPAQRRPAAWRGCRFDESSKTLFASPGLTTWSGVWDEDRSVLVGRGTVEDSSFSLDHGRTWREIGELIACFVLRFGDDVRMDCDWNRVDFPAANLEAHWVFPQGLEPPTWGGSDGPRRWSVVTRSGHLVTVDLRTGAMDVSNRPWTTFRRTVELGPLLATGELHLAGDVISWHGGGALAVTEDLGETWVLVREVSLLPGNVY